MNTNEHEFHEGGTGDSSGILVCQSPMGFFIAAHGNAMGSGGRKGFEPEGLIHRFQSRLMKQPFRLRRLLSLFPMALPWAFMSEPVGLGKCSVKGGALRMSRASLSTSILMPHKNSCLLASARFSNVSIRGFKKMLNLNV